MCLLQKIETCRLKTIAFGLNADTDTKSTKNNPSNSTLLHQFFKSVYKSSSANLWPTSLWAFLSFLVWNSDRTHCSSNYGSVNQCDPHYCNTNKVLLPWETITLQIFVKFIMHSTFLKRCPRHCARYTPKVKVSKNVENIIKMEGKQDPGILQVN